VAINISDEWTHSIRSFLGYWPLSIYAGYGALWILVLILIYGQNQKGRFYLIIGLVVIPSLASFVLSHDGTRVFAVVSSLGLFATIINWWQTHPEERALTSWLLPILFISLFLFPAVIVDASGEIRTPYEELLNFVGWQGYWIKVPFDLVNGTDLKW
jgi:hypothetical protein